MPYNALNVRITTFRLLVLSIPDFSAAIPSSSVTSSTPTNCLLFAYTYLYVCPVSPWHFEAMSVSCDSVLHLKMLHIAS